MATRTSLGAQEVVSGLIEEAAESQGGAKSSPAPLGIASQTASTLCIDVGGTKAFLEMLDPEGLSIPLFRKGVQEDRLLVGGGNINTVGVDGIREVLRTLFKDVAFGEEKRDLLGSISQFRIVAGMAGAKLHVETLTSLYAELGAHRDKVVVMADALMALDLVGDEGIIMISGTGSVLFGKSNGETTQVGGLGPVLGDEGSGYRIGLQAIQECLYAEQRKEPDSSLATALKAFFKTDDLKTLIPKINQGKMLPTDVAAAAPFVFEEAEYGNVLARVVIDQAAEQLGKFLATMLKVTRLDKCRVDLWGGVFKSPYVPAFVEKITKQLPAGVDLSYNNKADCNIASVYAAKHYYAH